MRKDELKAYTDAESKVKEADDILDRLFGKLEGEALDLDDPEEAGEDYPHLDEVEEILEALSDARMTIKRKLRTLNEDSEE
jgi:hypothetical protein